MKRYFCEICKVWVPDDSASRKRHETAASHIKRTQEAVSLSVKRTEERNKQEAKIAVTLAEMEAKARGKTIPIGEKKLHPLAQTPASPPKPVPRSNSPVKPVVDPATGLGTWEEVDLKTDPVCSKANPSSPTASPKSAPTKRTGIFRSIALPVQKRRKLDLLSSD